MCLCYKLKGSSSIQTNLLAFVFKVFQLKIVFSQDNIQPTDFRVDSESWMSVMGSMKCKVSNITSLT